MNCGIYVPYAPPGHNSPFDASHFCPFKGNGVRIGHEILEIPFGEEVVDAGVLTVYSDCIVNMIPNVQGLAPFTLYREYLFKDALGDLRINHDTTSWHKTSPLYGHEISEDDPSQSFIGMIYTDANGKVVGGGSSQMLLSWFNYCRSPLSVSIPWSSYTFDSDWDEIPGVKVEYLLMGLNENFPESFIQISLPLLLCVMELQERVHT